MNSIHDLGGMHGFGAIPIEENEPVFHAEWEKKALAMRQAMMAWGKWNLDMGRHSMERFTPAEYLGMSYYERRITSLADLLVESGMVSLSELTRGEAASGTEKQTPPLTAWDVPVLVQKGRSSARNLDTPPKFVLGDVVVTNTDNPIGHTRLPRYARGHNGKVVLYHGAHAFPDSRAHGNGDAPQHLYAVRFSAAKLWGASGSEVDSVTLDLWESYLNNV